MMQRYGGKPLSTIRTVWTSELCIFLTVSLFFITIRTIINSPNDGRRICRRDHQSQRSKYAYATMESRRQDDCCRSDGVEATSNRILEVRDNRHSRHAHCIANCVPQL